VAPRKGAGPAPAVTGGEARKNLKRIGNAGSSKATPQNPQAGATRLISDIAIGVRHRRDLGDIDALAASIGALGLLHPVVVQPDGSLVAGKRRLAACKLLGWTDVPVNVVDIEQIALGEYAENVERKDFTYAEAVEILRAVRPVEEQAAKERQREGQREGGKKAGRGRKGSGQIAHKQKSRATDKAAKATGKKRRTLQKAEAVVAAAEEKPELFGDLAERLKDNDVKVAAVHREMKQRQERANYEARAERGGDIGDLVQMAEAGRRFKVIVADPPWEFKVYSRRGRQRSAERYYDTLTLEAIKALPVAPLADADCALFLWGVWPELPGALEVIKAWGFQFKTVAFVWVKSTKTAEIIKLNGDGLHLGMGYWTRANTEFCLLATKGAPLCIAEDIHQVVLAPVGEHSAKPREIHSRIERLLAGPYLELFARHAIPNWTVWGNEAPAAEQADDPFAIPGFLDRRAG
jgi:N6-adenosine-specific RNA methylase IME4/ParB-like chromosome segregation protein Spo0J